jgi:hypothetical protein
MTYTNDQLIALYQRYIDYDEYKDIFEDADDVFDYDLFENRTTPEMIQLCEKLKSAND